MQTPRHKYDPVALDAAVLTKNEDEIAHGLLRLSVYQLCRGVCESDRDDAVQDLVIHLWQQYPNYRSGRCRPSTYFRRIGERRLRNWIRDRRKQQQREREMIRDLSRVQTR